MQYAPTRGHENAARFMHAITVKQSNEPRFSPPTSWHPLKAACFSYPTAKHAPNAPRFVHATTVKQSNAARFTYSNEWHVRYVSR